MKPSIRRKFNLGIAFFFLIILLLSVMSAIYLNRLSKKTGAILKENVVSVVYARNMMQALTNINREVSGYLILHTAPDSSAIRKELELFEQSLILEKNNITEIGEDKIAGDIDRDFKEYRSSVLNFINIPDSFDKPSDLQKKFNVQYTRLGLLSQMNERAIETKTDDARKSARKAWIQMSLIGSICFFIALGFTISFATYFNERFSQLYNGIKEIASSNYAQRLSFSENDEFYEISLVFNKMAEKLNETNQKKPFTLQNDLEHDDSLNDVGELKKLLIRMKSIEIQATDIIAKIENKN